ncbi:CTTNBP2 N-terminal-like protein [Periophthalmus magnuspinnatus]|uniref:CTTNBP2 N-terminal-like protein n=1 Tax=Periophthalmus magnuspinnatus TaxID=409849 RepID=UPI00145B026E|nr:CTTNBP2 N-terminal-like protein [Periophthalmus magnuspinnatus]
MPEFLKTSDGNMKSKLNMERLSKPELLMLFSVLEGELEARDLVIEALKAQRKDLFVQERYGRYNLSDPFLALQRDSEVMGGQKEQRDQGYSSSNSNPLVVLKLVVSHCRRMQDKMLAQLAAAESRHRRVIADLEEEKRRHAEDTAEGDDVTYILEKERERLQQQLEFERSQVRRLEKEQRRLTEQLEEERAQHKQLSCALAKECKWASARALEEGHRLSETSRKLDKERESCHTLKRELEEERRKALRMEARVEEQLAEFDTEREQLRSRLKKEEAHCCQLQLQVEELRRKLADVTSTTVSDCTIPAEDKGQEWATKVPFTKQVHMKVEDLEEDRTHLQPCVKINGHHEPIPDKVHLQNGTDTQSTILPPLSPSTSPNLTRHPTSTSTSASSPTSYQSPYQAGIHQRFHAARHKFQSTSETEPALSSPLKEQLSTASPPEASPVKQLARSTVTQVLSRFTSAQPKLTTPNPSPFGTDYRNLATPLSPVIGRATGALQQGIRSPTIARAERGIPPPIPPKKPGLAQAPPSPATTPKSGGHLSDSSMTGSCGLISGQEGVKEMDMVVSSS